MKELERLKAAVDYLKSKDDFLTNEVISERLEYKAKNYLSDILSGNKKLNKFFLSAFEDKFQISSEWIHSGKGNMILELSSTNDRQQQYSNNTLQEKYIQQLEENNKLLKELLNKTNAAIEQVNISLDVLYKNQVGTASIQLAVQDELIAFVAKQTNQDLDTLKKKLRNKSISTYNEEIQKGKQSVGDNVGK
jgi:hypothetical protein